MSDSEQRNIDRYWKREETALGRAFNDVMDGARELANRVHYVLPGRTQSEKEMFQRAIREDREEKQWTREHYKQTGRMETRDDIAAEAHYSAQRARTPYEARQEREIQNALGGGEREAAQARERLDYQLRHSGAAEYAERHADLASDATVDKGQISKMIRQETTHSERFDINAPWRENLPQVNTDWTAQQITKQMEGDPGFRNQIGRASEERYSQDLARRSSTQQESMAWTKVEKIGRQAVDGKENGTMDSEVKAAKQHVREREQERWTRVEQIGRQAIDSDRARVTEKPTATTEADLATKAERQRPQTA